MKAAMAAVRSWEERGRPDGRVEGDDDDEDEGEEEGKASGDNPAATTGAAGAPVLTTSIADLLADLS
jgi:hypothetical protein